MTTSKASVTTTTMPPRTWEQTHGTARPPSDSARTVTIPARDLELLLVKAEVCDWYIRLLTWSDARLARTRLRAALDTLSRLRLGGQ
jgi:hypothetical protein